MSSKGSNFSFGIGMKEKFCEYDSIFSLFPFSDEFVYSFFVILGKQIPPFVCYLARQFYTSPVFSFLTFLLKFVAFL